MSDAHDAADELERLRAEAVHARQRLDLYQAKAYGMREINPVKMRDLERRAEAAAERLAAVRRQGVAPE